MELVGCRDLLLGGGDEGGKLVASVGPGSGLVFSILRDPVEGRLPAGNRLRLVPNELHNVAERVVIRFAAEENGVLASLTGVLASVGLVPKLWRRAGNVGARKTKDALVGLVGAETDEDATRAFVVRCAVRGDGETESQAERLPKGGSALQLGVRVEWHELRLAVIVGLDEGNLNLGEPSALEFEQR